MRQSLSRRIRYLGPISEAAPPLLLEGCALELDQVIELRRTRSPWNAYRPQERVILGSDPARADVLLESGTSENDGDQETETIEPEHLRFYLPRDGQGPDDLKVIVDGTVDINGRSVLHSEWYALQTNDELVLAQWRFRYEREETEAPPSS